MSPQILNTILLIISLLLYLFACKVLIEDARKGYSVTMGAEMYFSQLWTLASLLAVIGVIRQFQLSWWLFLPAVVVLYLASFPVRRGIKAVFLGMDDQKPAAKDGISTHRSDNK